MHISSDSLIIVTITWVLIFIIKPNNKIFIASKISTYKIIVIHCKKKLHIYCLQNHQWSLCGSPTWEQCYFWCDSYTTRMWCREYGHKAVGYWFTTTWICNTHSILVHKMYGTYMSELQKLGCNLWSDFWAKITPYIHTSS